MQISTTNCPEPALSSLAFTSSPMLIKKIGTNREKARVCIPSSICSLKWLRLNSNPARNAPIIAAIPPMTSADQA